MTDIRRILTEVDEAKIAFYAVESFPDGQGGVFVKAGLQTSACHCYVVSIYFVNYPSQMPRVFVTKPALQNGCPHIYREGHICFLHPNMWNPGRHNLTFVLARTAKWLNKYEVWRLGGSARRWPGAEVAH